MKKFIIGFLVLILSGLVIGLYYCPYIARQLHTYALRSTQEQFGDQPVDASQEAFVQTIAQEMGITEPIILRKMNTQTLHLFGYWNACALFPLFGNCIPLSNQPFLYISQGFFEDLTPQEQRFLIGHELIHIKERHARLYNLFFFMAIFITIILFTLLRKLIIRGIERYINSRHFIAVIFFALLSMSLWVPSLIGLWYRRHIEWQADIQSIAALQSYDGGIKLMERWVKQFRIPWHNEYAGLWADHPSCFERRAYCLTCKNTSEGQLT